MLKQLLCLLAISCTWVSYGQSLTLSNYTISAPLTGCETSVPFQFGVSNTQAFSTTDSVFFNFSFPQGVQLETFSISGGPGIVGFTQNTAYVTGIPSGTQFTIQHQLKLNCNVLNPTTISTSHQVSFDLNHGTSSTINSNSYFITPSSLVFVGGTNLDYNAALFNVPITRTYVFRNSLSSPFTGSMSFLDSTALIQSQTGFRLDSAYVSYGNAIETSSLFNDSTVLLNINITGLEQSDSIVITEIGYLIGCQTSAIENSRTRFTATFGCSPADACAQVTYNVPNQALAHFDPNDKPIALFKPDEHSEACVQEASHLRYVIKNNGAGAANGGRIEFNVPIAQPQTINSTHYYLDSMVLDSIKVTVGGQQVPASSITYFEGAGNGYRYIHAIANIPPGDSIIFEYDVLYNCIPPSEYDLYFNHRAYFHALRHPLGGWLYHPCTNSYSPRNGEYNHPIGLEQSFTSLVGQMGDTTSAWFEVDNASPFILGHKYDVFDPLLIPQGTTYLVPFDPDSAVLEIRLQLENGLLFPNLDSLYMSSQNGAVTTTLDPFNIYVIPGTGIGTGDEVVAQFHIPANWSLPYPLGGHEYYIVTADFLQFFNAFKVNFKLKADCNLAPYNGVVHVLQEFFINPTPACGDCKLPLSQVGTRTNINCPGCVLPGWNLTSFSLERTNIGSIDANNNHLPDAYPTTPANIATINLAAAMMGDTLRGSITGFVSDGQDVDSVGNPVGYTFASAGFAFDEGMIEFSLDVVPDLEFIGGTGSITIDDSTYLFSVPATAAQLSTNGNIGIPMNIAALNSYGVSQFAGYDATVTNFTFEPEFRIIRNLNNASGGNPYYDARIINCFLYMGGTEFTAQGLSQGTFADANTPSNTDFLVASSPAVREGSYKYWCTSYEGRFLGVGLDLKTRFASAGENVYPYGSICLKGITYQHMVSTGKAIYEPALGPNQTSANIFHQEIRSISTLDSLTFNFPPEYTPSVIDFYNHNIAFDALTNVHKWSQVQRFYPLSDAVIGNDYVTIFPAQFIDEITAFPPHPTPYHFANEENQVYTISFYLVPKDCSNLPELTPYTNNTFDVSFSNYPLALDSQDTSYSVPITINSLNNAQNFRNPNPELILTEEGNGVTASGVNYWDVDLTTDAVADLNYQYDEAIIHSAENVFVTFESPSGNFSNININTVITYTGPDPSSAPATQVPLWADPTTSYDPYALNYVGYNLFVNKLISKKFRINADFDCSNLPAGSVDSIYVIKGWNCLNYPTTLAEACFVDTAVLYYYVPETALAVSVSHEDTVSTCSSTNVSVVFDPTVGQTDSISVTLFNSPSQSYTYIPGSAYVVNASGTTYIEPVIIGNALQWSLDGLSSIFSEPVVFNYQLQTACDFETDSVFTNFQAYNYCGLQISNIDDYWSPTFISNLPELDSLSLSLSATSGLPCGDTAWIQLEVLNVGDQSTGALNEVTVQVPSGYVYGGGALLASSNGNALTFDLAANTAVGATETIDFYLLNTNTIACGSYPVSASLTLGATYYCGNALCTIETLDGAASASTEILIETEAPVIDCPADITLPSGTSTATWTLSATDDCGLASVVSDIPSGSEFNVGTTTVTVTATDSCGNSSNCTFTVTRESSIEVDAGPCATVYLGYGPTECTTLTASIIIGSNGPYTYVWSNGAMGSTTIVCPTQTTTYTVTVTDGNGSTASATVLVNVVDARCGHNGDKVSVCHVPPGNPPNVQQICIAPQAVGAHVDPSYGHSGCYVGPCGMVDPCNGGNRTSSENPNTEENSELHVVESIYPNPNTGLFTVQLSENVILSETRIDVYDVVGKLVYTTNPQDLLVDIDLTKAHATAAVYMVHVHSGAQLRVERVIVQ